MKDCEMELNVLDRVSAELYLICELQQVTKNISYTAIVTNLEQLSPSNHIF